MNPKVDLYLDNVKNWQEEIKKLRAILLSCQLTEALKWRVPCYTFQNKNIAIIGNFKDFCSISFFKGVLLKDTKGVLVAPGENSQSSRLIKFTNVKEILELENTIKAYIYEAIEIEKAGLKVEFKKELEPIPEEFQNKLKELPALKKAFNALTPGKKRGYILYFSGAKQSKSRSARVEKYIPRILDGYGIHDCVCGHSKKPPKCDGSHKYINKTI